MVLTLADQTVVVTRVETAAVVAVVAQAVVDVVDVAADPAHSFL